jgi:hypothetical protein
MATADKRLQYRQQAQDYTRMRAEQRAADKELNAGLAKMREEEKKVAAARTEQHRRVMEAKEARESSTAGRIAGAVGWAGPQQLYYMQAAVEALLPAIGGATLLGLMGVAGAAVGGLAIANFASGQTQSGAAINAVAGLPAGGSGEFTSAGAITAAQLRANVGTDKTAMDITTGLAQGGLSSAQALGPAFDLAATAVHVFGVSAQEAAFFVSNSMVTLGKSAQDTAMLMEGIAATAVGTGTPAAQLMQMAGNPDLAATINGDTAPLNAAFTQVGGGLAGGTTLEQMATAHGQGGLVLAQLAGMGASQMDVARSTPQGAANVEQAALNNLIGQYNAAASPEAGYAVVQRWFSAMGVPAPSFAEWQHLAANAGGNQLTTATSGNIAAAAKARADAIAAGRLGAQGAHQSALGILAGGDVSGANNAASPLTPQEQAGLNARLAFDNAAAGDTSAPGMPGGGTLHGMSYDPTSPYADVLGLPSAGPVGPAGAASLAAAAVTQPNGQVAPNAVQIVQGAAEVVIRLVNDATGRTVAVKNISIPLSNGQQSADQYLSRSGEARPS